MVINETDHKYHQFNSILKYQRINVNKHHSRLVDLADKCLPDICRVKSELHGIRSKSNSHRHRMLFIISLI